MKLKLFLKNKGTTFTLHPNKKPEVIVGSAPNSDLLLSNGEVASQHFKFVFDNNKDTWYIEDLGSTKGTLVNNEYIHYRLAIKTQINIRVDENHIIAQPENFQESFEQQPTNSYVENNISSSKEKNIYLETREDIFSSIEKITQRQRINRNFFDRSHPSEYRGYRLDAFSISLNKNIPAKDDFKINELRFFLYKSIHDKLGQIRKNDQYLDNKLSFKLRQYIDSKYSRNPKKKDRERLYLEIKLETVRNGKVTTLCRFFEHGDNLYIGVDSYILASLKIGQLMFQILVAIILTISLPFLFIPFVVPGLLGIWYMYKVWIRFIRAKVQGEKFSDALRINFPNTLSTNSFEKDDYFIYLKSILPLIINCLQEGLDKYNLLEPEINDYLKEISGKIGQQAININTGGGNILGSIFGGEFNKINN